MKRRLLLDMIAHSELSESDLIRNMSDEEGVMMGPNEICFVKKVLRAGVAEKEKLDALEKWAFIKVVMEEVFNEASVPRYMRDDITNLIVSNVEERLLKVFGE